MNDDTKMDLAREPGVSAYLRKEDVPSTVVTTTSPETDPDFVSTPWGIFDNRANIYRAT